MTRRLAVVAVLAMVAILLPVLPATGTPPEASTRDIPVRDWVNLPDTSGLRTLSHDDEHEDPDRDGATGGQDHDDGADGHDRDRAQRLAAVTHWTRSAPMPARDAVLVGADWGGDPDVLVQVRGRTEAGWQDWQDLPPEHDEHRPDPSSPEAAATTTASSPAWLGRVDKLQVRVAGAPPADLELKTVALSGGDGPDYLPPELRGGNAAQAAPDKPGIVPRQSWDPNDDCRPRSRPSYASDVRFAYVHHTASRNNYRASEGPSMVRSFCLYHRNSRGWSDIGYNFLVDKYGRVYEGRAGGAEDPVIGAHAAGFNAGSVGVSAIGNFSEAAPTADMITAIRRLLAWKLDVHHVDPHGSTTEVSGGGGTNRYPSGRQVTLPTIVGHRDTGTTSCPGSNLYRYISSGTIHRDVHNEGLPKLYGGQPPRVEQPVIGERPHWQVKLAPSSDWSLTIRDRDGNVVRRGSDSNADRVGIRWDMRDSSGNEVPPGRYTATFEMEGRDANPITTRFDVTASTERRHGAERIATSIALSRFAFSDSFKNAKGHPQAERVVVAGAYTFPDALVATPLAASYGGPVLLTRQDRLPREIADEIRRLGAREAYVVGGPGRVSNQVLRDLEHAGARKVERLSGPTRYHTAGAVAWRVVQREGPREAVLALGQHPNENLAFQDALVAGAFGGEFDLPVMLVQPRSLTEPTAWVLKQRDWSRGVSIVGGNGVIRQRVRDDAAHASRASVRTYAGSDHFDTSRIVAEETLKRWSNRRQDPNADPKGLEVVLATGDNWPDGLGAGAAAVQRGASFLLVPSEGLVNGHPSREWIRSHRGWLVHAVVAGGPNAVSPRVVQQVDTLIRSDGPNTRAPEEWPNDSPDPIALPIPPG